MQALLRHLEHVRGGAGHGDDVGAEGLVTARRDHVEGLHDLHHVRRSRRVPLLPQAVKCKRKLSLNSAFIAPS